MQKKIIRRDVQLPEGLHEALKREAIKREMTVNGLLAVAIREWLESQVKQ